MHKYCKLNYPEQQPGDSTLLTGIRGKYLRHKEVVICGFFESTDYVTSFIYRNDKWYNLNFPNMTVTNLYGPDIIDKHTIRVVGNYNVSNNSPTIACIYEGKYCGQGKWTSLNVPDSTNSIAHSTMGDLVVGNYETVNNTSGAFIYNIKTQTYTKIIKEHTQSISAYGIWQNSANKYTICGGYININADVRKNVAYIVDYDEVDNHKVNNHCGSIHKLHHWREYSYGNDPITQITHFDGITKSKTGYNLTGDYIKLPNFKPQAFFCSVKRSKNRFSKLAYWKTLAYPDKTITSGNSIYENIVIGVYTSSGGTNGYVSQI